MNVRLLEHTHLSSAVIAARTCWNSFHKGGLYDYPTNEITEEDKTLLSRLLFKNKHESIFEHIVYVFNILGIPRLCLQELARHRIASYSVKSTRYTLKELKSEKSFLEANLDDYTYSYDFDRAEKYIEFNDEVSSKYQVNQLDLLREEIANGVSLDDAKYLLPESYLTDLVMTINVRSLRNFSQLRLSKSAHKSIRALANEMLTSLPVEHLFLYKDLLEENKND
nr:MAG TPA: FAD-dependent thymidylate synthase [Caudoviricetes sp.]